MKSIQTHDVNLNIHYTAPDEVWEKIKKVYREMPCWIAHTSCWYGKNFDDEQYIIASVEPSGIQFMAKLPQEEWDKWFTLLKNKLTEVLGYEIGEPEDGFEFKYYK